MKHKNWDIIQQNIKIWIKKLWKAGKLPENTVIFPLAAGLALIVILAAVLGVVDSVVSAPKAVQTETWETRNIKDLSSEIWETESISEDVLEKSETPYLGWRLQNGSWYYFTEEGAAVGYQTISEYGREDECYFEADGRLVMNAQTPDGRMADSDGYLIDAQDEAAEAEDWSAFEVEAAKNLTPGALSGLRISGEPAEFYMLSIAGESSGGQILMGDRGRAYGLCQFDYRHDLTNFMRWAYSRHPSLWQEFSAFTEKAVGDESLVDNQEICQAFANARMRDYEAAISDELEYMRMDYWDSFASRMNAAGYALSSRHIAVSAAFFSVLVNCGKKTTVFLENLSPDMTDAQMICGIYKIRNTILAEQNVGRSKKGTTARYRMAEPRMALDLLHGFTTIDSVKNYGGGVQWNGNLFTGTIMTNALNGSSTEWEEALAETLPEAEPESGAVEENSESDAPGNTGEEHFEEEADVQPTSAAVIVTGKAAKKMAETAESVMEHDPVTEQKTAAESETMTEHETVAESETVAGHEMKTGGNTKDGSEPADTQPDTEKQAE